MWDQKTGLNISAREGSERMSGPNHQAIDDKKILESTGEDSGFISGPQILYSSESIDSHSDIVPYEEEDKQQEPMVQDKQIVESTGADSGFLSGQIDNTKETMLFRDSIDRNMSEWMCGMSLKNSSGPLNNLGNTQNTGVEAPNLKKMPKRELWEICYVQDADGDTQLHLAILGKYVKAVWTIIRLAPVPEFLDIRNDDAHAPLHLAVLSRQPEIVRCLLLAGAKASIQDKEGNTPLHLACMNSDKACVDALTLPISHEDLQQHYNVSDRIPQVLPPDLEQRNYHGMHCVHIAAQRNDIEILRHLVWLGADINAREGKSGYTALHLACENSNEQLAQFLLKECSKINVETCTYGLLTAYQLAAEQKNCNLMGNLERCGAELLSPPESDDDSYFDSSEDDFHNYESDDCELN